MNHLTRPQHLSDEAVAAFADGVLTGHARERASKHTAECPECADAVRVQREAAWALRAAVAPDLPSGLLDRLRTLPQHTPITSLPTVVGPDGSTMLSTLGAPMAALVPAPPTAWRTRARPFVLSAAAVALAGALTTAAFADDLSSPGPGGPAIQQPSPGGGGAGSSTVPFTSLFTGRQP